jgi:hypothetical protein
MLSVLLVDVVRMSEGSNKAPDRIGWRGSSVGVESLHEAIKYRLP